MVPGTEQISEKQMMLHTAHWMCGIKEKNNPQVQEKTQSPKQKYVTSFFIIGPLGFF